ncbi:MAG: hypothetical protein JNK79_12180 [Chitinophagaceae bacterium]|nr:hypothetical protein [Chitinophagaceae bacterium]
MNPAKSYKKFIFNEKIDEDYLFSLYQDDYEYIVEIFNSSLDSLKEETAHLATAFESSDIGLLKNVTHKIKPIFGFTGLLHHQEMLTRFEQLCANAKGISNVTIQYMEVNELLKEGRSILKDDFNRLTEFIS